MGEPVRVVVVPFSFDFLQSPAGFAVIVAVIVVGFLMWLLSLVAPRAPAGVYVGTAIGVTIAVVWYILTI